MAYGAHAFPRRAGLATLWSAVLAALLALALPAVSLGDSLRSTVEYNYTVSELETRTQDGETTRAESRSFGQRYRLGFDKSLYPYLTLRGGGLFERTDTSVETGTGDSDVTFTRLNPFAELVLASPLYTGALGYNRQEEESQSSGASSKLIRDVYTARLGWRPEEAPSMDLQYSRTDTYDPGREDEDRTLDSIQLISRYQPVSTVDLLYQGTLNRSEDRLSGVQTDEVAHAGRVSYDDRFWGNRLSLSTTYAVTNRTSETRAPLGAEVTAVVAAVAGLFALDDSPQEGELAPAPALIDGSTGVSAGIDLGLPAVGDFDGTVPRNLGLDLLDPGAQVNGLRVWVDRQLTPEVASSFRWEVWVSQNNLDWDLWQTVPSAPFGPFENVFELRFATARARYVKLVVVPLSPTVVGAPAFSSIFVTELRAQLTLPGDQISRETTQTGHQVSIASRAQLLNDPNLAYTFTLLYARTDPDSVSRSLVSNALSLTRRLRPWLTGAAQAAREDVDEPAGNQVLYRYGVSLAATPLPTLSHTAVYSGRTEQSGEGDRVRNSVFLNNRAALYRGVDVLLNGGVSEDRADDGERSRSYLVNAGVEILPHRTMTWGFFYSADWFERSGGERPDSSTVTRRTRASVSWNPLAAVNLFASAEMVEGGQGRMTLYNWAGNWSPLRDGTLQLTFAYSETLQIEEDTSVRLLSPSLRWEVRRGTFLDLTYSFIESESGSRKTENRVISANLQANF